MKRFTPEEVREEVTDEMRHKARKLVIKDGFEPLAHLVELTAVGLWLRGKLEEQGVPDDEAYRIAITCGKRALKLGPFRAAAFTWNRWVSGHGGQDCD